MQVELDAGTAAGGDRRRRRAQRRETAEKVRGGVVWWGELQLYPRVHGRYSIHHAAEIS